LKLNEYGFFRIEGDNTASATEDDIYQALGLAWVPGAARTEGKSTQPRTGSCPT
jgi:DNA polymerase/3'-5' exonuclease PolX